MSNDALAPVVLVLEDSAERVEWLRTHVPDYCQVVATADVPEFWAAYAAHCESGALQLVIMDHDLGNSAPTPYAQDSDQYDLNGLTGLDAAEGLPAPVTQVPIIVWSWNAGGAKRMVATLQERGCNVAQLPFGTPQLRNILHYLCYHA